MKAFAFNLSAGMAILASLCAACAQPESSLISFGGVYNVGGEPYGTRMADLDGDGNLDVIVQNDRDFSAFGDGYVSILLGKGDGTFETAVNYDVYDSSLIVVNDFNDDGILDIATGGYSYFVSVLIGKGDGTFKAAVTTASEYAADYVVGDFNEDNILDLASVYIGLGAGGPISILLGNGDGTFTVTTMNPDRVVPLAAGDFDRDGTLDLAAAGQGFVAILLGNGDGTFAAPVNYDGSRNYIGTIEAADLNGDAALDLVMGGDEVVAVMIGKGDGTFEMPVNHALDEWVDSIEIADLTGDNNPDIMAFGSDPAGVLVLIGQGDGTFARGATYGAGLPIAGFFGSYALSDIDGDGVLDIVWSGQFGGTIQRGNGDGTFAPGVTYISREDYGSVSVGDINNDGKPDLAVLEGPGSSPSDDPNPFASVLIFLNVSPSPLPALEIWPSSFPLYAGGVRYTQHYIYDWPEPEEVVSVVDVVYDTFSLGIRMREAVTSPCDVYLFADSPEGVFTILPDGRRTPGIKALYRNLPGIPAPLSVEVRPAFSISRKLSGKSLTFHIVVAAAGVEPSVGGLRNVKALSSDVIAYDRKTVRVTSITIPDQYSYPSGD